MNVLISILQSPIGPYLMLIAGLGILGVLSRHFVTKQDAQNFLTKEELSLRFATKEELNGFGGRVTEAEEASRGADAKADRAIELTDRLDAVQSERHDAMVKTMERITLTMEQVSREQHGIQLSLSQNTAVQTSLTRDVERLFRKYDNINSSKDK